MKKLAAVIAFGLGFGMIAPGLAIDGHENSTGSAAAQPAATPDAKDPANGSNGQESKKSKHTKKVAHGHKKKNQDADGDGEPMNEIGKRKHVDGGFDFENSKKFHTMGNDQ